MVLNGPHKNEHVQVKEVGIGKLNIKKYNNFNVSNNYIFIYI